MKIQAIQPQKVAFKGYMPIKDEHGYNQFEFNFPFDEERYECYLEVFNVGIDRGGNYYITNKLDNTDDPYGQFKMKSGSNKVDLAYSYFIDNDTPFAYHYKLVRKGTDNVTYHIDSGDVIDSRPHHQDWENQRYNIVTRKGSKLNHGGSMKLIIPDNYNPGWQYVNNIPKAANDTIARKSFKHFSNKIGGTLAGIEKGVERGEFDGYSNIISLPLFTDDSISSHGYWNKNCMQMIPTLGNINNYASLQRKMFAKGLNFVSDGAFVNEGLMGVHFANMLKYGENSPYFNWFKASGLENGPFLLGVFGKNQDFVSHKIVNSPYKYEQKQDGQVKISRNKNYDSKKPTYVQIFDKRLVTDEQANDNKNLIKKYDILNTKNPYDINTHDDTVVNYYFEIDPEIYNKNVKNLNEYNRSANNKVFLNTIMGTRFVNKYENFELEDKIESNFETWDANTDIAKLNYVYSHSSTETGKNLTSIERQYRDKISKRANCEVQDYVVTSGIYWTQKTKDILTLHAAQQLKDIESEKDAYNAITDGMKNGTLPQKIKSVVNAETIKNSYNFKYDAGRESLNESFQDQILRGLMNLPLDSIEFGDNLAGTFASPYMTKRAETEAEIGVSRFDIYKQGNPNLVPEYSRAYLKMEKIYENEMRNFANDILKKVENDLKEQISDGDKVTKYGEYVLPLMTQEIAKFAIIKALQPNAKVTVKDGEIFYDYDALKEVSLQTLGINGVSPEDDALELIQKIKTGLNNISSSDKKLLSEALTKSFKGTNAHSFAVADMIIDKTQSGLDWRIDATKDVADVDALRDGKNNFDYTWQMVTNFWQKFNQGVLSVNPNAYMVAEVTDEGGLHGKGHGYQSRISGNEITKKFLNETGMTATANYTYLFDGVYMMFGQRFEANNNMEMPIDDYFQERISKKIDEYIRTSNLNSLAYSYTFAGNHDKPRALHCFALDMGQFFADLTMYEGLNAHQIARKEAGNYYTKDKIDYYRKRAYQILEDRALDDVQPWMYDGYDFSRVSSKAIAMADTLMTSVGKSIDKLANEDKDFAYHRSEIYAAMAKSIRDLAKGTYRGKNFNADAFAVKPFDVVIDTLFDQAIHNNNLKLSNGDVEKFKKETFNTIIEPAFTKLLGAMKYYVALPGKPTLYSGDDLGATGYEEKTKNIYLQNRGYLHREWLNTNDTVKKYHELLNQVMAMRSRPELDALNNGAVFALPVQTGHNGEKVSAVFRQNTDGKMAVSLFNTNGIHHDPMKNYDSHDTYLYSIKLTDMGEYKGLKGGLTQGLEFVNANDPNDKYYVHRYGEDYYLEHFDKNDPIRINDSTMILYHVPKKEQVYPVSFTGNYKPSAKYVTNVYSKAF